MWKAGLVALMLVAGCAAQDYSNDRVGQGATPQERIVSAVGLNVSGASQAAGNQSFRNARDTGFATTSAISGGALGAAGGLAGILASETAPELYPFLILEAGQDTDIEALEASVASEVAPLIGLQSGEVTVAFTRQGTANGREIYSTAFYSDGGTSTSSRVLRQLADRFPSVLSTYVPPLRVNGEWQRPYLYRRGSRLPL